MKNNLILLGILVTLIFGTYLFQEKRVARELKESREESALLSTEILTLELPSIKAEKINGQWMDGKTLLSFNTFKQIEKKISEIMKIKEISGDWVNYSRHSFPFKVNGEDWSIGDLSLDKQSFYIKQGQKIYLAVIEGGSHHLTSNEEEIEEIKLNELLNFLSKKKNDLVELQLFRYFPTLPLGRIVISNEGDLPFELNLDSNMTQPGPISGVEVHSNLKNKFMSLLTQATIKEVTPLSEIKKFKKLGEINFLSGNQNVKWELWLKSDKSADAIIIDPLQKKSFLMVGGTLKIFFVRLQDYWDKKVIPSKDFTSFTQVNAEFIQGSKRDTITIVNKEPIEFESKKFNIDTPNMELLTQIIFNLGQRDQAERVSILTKAEKTQLLSGDYLKIRVMNQELLIWRKTEELIVANLTQGFKAHFTLLDEKFRGRFEDVLK
jgi:hypothetical protein